MWALVKTSLVLPASRSWIWSLTVGKTLFLQSLSCDPSTQGKWEERLPVKLRQKVLCISAFSSSALMVASCAQQGHMLSFAFLLWLTYLQKSLLWPFASLVKFYFSHALAFLTPSLHNEGCVFTSSASPAPCDQLVVINSHTPVLYFTPPSFSNDN